MVKIACGLLQIVPWCLSHSIIRRKMVQKHLSSWIQLFFERFDFEMILSLAQLVSKHLVDPYKMLLDICDFRLYGKVWSIIFFHWKGCLYLKSLCFQQPLRFLKKCSYKFYSNGTKNLWTLVNCSLRLITLNFRSTWKNEPNYLSSWKLLYFEMFVSIVLLGLRRNDPVVCTIFAKKKPCGAL